VAADENGVEKEMCWFLFYRSQIYWNWPNGNEIIFSSWN